MVYSNLMAKGFVGFELLRGHKVFDEEFFAIGLQVLSDGDDVNASLFKICHRLKDLLFVFAKPNHHAGFDEERLFGCLGSSKDTYGAFVSRFVTDAR